ncbi:putative invertase inhibitor [Ananas comosus]|uniref:Invertase inhibitor n=1 Tax=Ananas comosus TaxID=4615 RepID=A0A6P5EGE9_ANACO|nr:putative invertase inhibitor [Ananas comosus]
MKTILLIVSALALFLQNSWFSSASLEENCRRIHELDPYQSYDFCVTSFQVVSESHTANLSQLGIIASELTIKNYTHTLVVVQQLLKNQSLSHWQRAALNDCNETYSSGIEHAILAITEIKSGDFSSAASHLDGEFFSLRYL